MKSILTSKWTKVVVFLACLAPFARLLWRGFHGDLTADPIAFVTHTTGDWTLRFVIITLAITPLRKILHLPLLIRFRRMLGLFAFFYGCLHFSTWIGLDKQFAWAEMWKDVHKRRFITVGFTGFVLMIPLAITSTAGWIRRLGGRRWQRLHQAIYLTGVAGVIHYYWLVKSDVRKPVFYGFLVALLLAWRFGVWLVGRRRKSTGGPTRREEPVTAETI
ncbi:MAG TPA: protein-methionine-sulfoxide reductase heme-binding subunit MsrQ [Candidatus Acidoferrales bacterium]|nr:protein-methionine-sulfoxide reductase heme-binding subunit MsrQ [Candidatus Acidoferrales bacterium]